MEAVYGIIIIVILGIAWAIFCRAIGTGVDNGVNAVTNAMKREHEKKNPPKPENLADRYK